MADKPGLSIDYVVKTIFDTTLAADIKKAMATKNETAINKVLQNMLPKVIKAMEAKAA